MGSTISLGIERLELDWGKNSFFRNHSALFLPGDRKPATYHYADDVCEQKDAYVRSLRSVARRLDMLGYTPPDCRRLYAEAVGDVPDHYDPPLLSYDEYAGVLRRIKLASIRLPEEGDWDLGEYVSKAVMRDPQFSEADRRLATITKDDGTFFENLDPYVTLRLLAENPENLDRLVTWRFADVVEDGYVDEKDIYEGVPAREVCLIVTEGSSDSAVLKASLPKIAPDLVDFFDFVDMTDNYPFTGTGNVVRFAQGLARIRIQNRILIVVDNDTAGHSAFRRVSALDLPERMQVVTLPDLESCRRFDTLGPSGPGVEDINGRAVSIELFSTSRAPSALRSRAGRRMTTSSSDTRANCSGNKLTLNDSWRRRRAGRRTTTASSPSFGAISSRRPPGRPAPVRTGATTRKAVSPSRGSPFASG